MSTTSVGRISWVDTAKGIGLICVILGHLHIRYIDTWVYTFHIPLFFFLSGVVFSGSKYSFKDFLNKKFKTLIIPYFFLGIGIYLFNAIILFIEKQPSTEYINMLKKFLVQEHYWTIWYLACLFFVEIGYYLINILLKENKLVVSIVSLIICIFGLLRYRFGLGSLPWNIDVAFVAQFFFHCGYLFKLSESKIKSWYFKFKSSNYQSYLIILVTLIINFLFAVLCIKLSRSSLDMSVGLYGNEICTFISAFAGIFMTIKVADLISCKFLTYMGQNTMVIFGWHSRIVIVGLSYAYDALGIFQTRSNIFEEAIFAVVSFVLILLILIPINELIKKTPCRVLIGIKRKG